jgi:hypothetical protein
VFENRALRGIYGPKEEEQAGGIEKAALQASQHIVRVIKSRLRWVRHVGRRGHMRNTWKILVGKSAEKRTVRSPRRWEDNIKMGLTERRWEGVI